MGRVAYNVAAVANIPVIYVVVTAGEAPCTRGKGWIESGHKGVPLHLVQRFGR